MQGQEDGTYKKLASIGPVIGVSRTQSDYWVTRSPGIGKLAVNFDPTLRYGSLSLIPGRTSGFTQRIAASGLVTSIGIFYQETNQGKTQNQFLAYIGSTGSMYGVGITNQPLHPPPAASLLVGYATLKGQKARFRTFMEYCFFVTNGRGTDGLGDVPQKIGYKQYVGADITTWQIPPPRHGAPHGDVIADGTVFPPDTFYIANGVPPPDPGNIPPFFNDGTSHFKALSGFYWYRACYYASSTDQESSPSVMHPPGAIPQPVDVDQATYPDGAGVLVDLTNLGVGDPPPDPLVDFINVYRVGGESSVWTLITSVPIGTQFFIDNTGDGALIGQNMEEHQDPPPNFRAIELHKGRIFGFGYDFPYQYNFSSLNKYVTTPPQPSDLWYTDFNVPWAFDCVSQVQPVERGVEGDTAVGLLSLSSVLLCFKEKTTHVCLGETNEDFYVIKAFDIGCLDEDTIDKCQGMGFWLSRSGVHMSDGQSQFNISKGEGNVQGDIWEDLSNLITTPGTKFSGFCDTDSYFLFELTTNVGWRFYLPKMSWSQINLLQFEPLTVSIPEKGLVYGLTPDDNVLTKWFNQVNDYLGNIELTWDTGNMDSGAQDLIKNYAYIEVIMAPNSHMNKILLNVIVDNELVMSNQPSGVDIELSPRERGSSYYRIGLPLGTMGSSIRLVFHMFQLDDDSPIVVDDVIVWGTYDVEQLPPTMDGDTTLGS